MGQQRGKEFGTAEGRVGQAEFGVERFPGAHQGTRLDRQAFEQTFEQGRIRRRVEVVDHAHGFAAGVEQGLRLARLRAARIVQQDGFVQRDVPAQGTSL